MFTTLLSKEVRQHLLTFRFAAALVTTFVLVLASVWILGEDYSRRRSTYNAAAEQTAIENNEFRIPTQISPTVHRPPSPLSIFAEGEDRRLGNSVEVNRWIVPFEATGSFTDNALMSALPPFDLLTIFSIVVSLFGLLMTYDAVSGEREDGTLKLMCTGSLKRGLILGSKLVAGIVCIAIPFLLSMLCCLLLLQFVFGIQFTPDQWTSISGMAPAALFYSALFIALGLLTSVLFKRSSTALVFGLFIWSIVVLVIPGAAQSISLAWAQPPKPAEVDKLRQDLRQDFRDKLEAFEAGQEGNFSGWCGGYGGSSRYFMYDGIKINYLYTCAYTRFIEPLMLSDALKIWEVRGRQEALLERQAQLAATLASASPAYQLRKCFTKLAGTDVSAYEDFLRAARRYREQMIEDFRNRGYFDKNAISFFSRRSWEELGDEQVQQRYLLYRRLAQEDPERYRTEVGVDSLPPLPPDHIPPFRHGRNGIDLNEVLAPVAYLAVATILVFAVALVAFIRYDVR